MSRRALDKGRDTSKNEIVLIFGLECILTDYQASKLQAVRLWSLIRSGVFAVAVAASASCSQEPNVTAAPGASLQERFQITLDALRDKHGFPGATAAYVLPDGSTGVAATGLADVENKIPMSKESRMLAASVGKSFVAATVLALAQEGRLDLDDRLSKYLGQRPWFPRLPNHEKITIRHLLTHSAGLPDHVYLDEFAEAFSEHWREPGNPFPPEKLVEFILDKPALSEPGEEWSYSDTGYILIGLVIEGVAEHSYYDEVTRRFLEPLHLDYTAPSNSRELPGIAAGYTGKGNSVGFSQFLPEKSTVAPGVMAWNPAVEWTGGGLVSHPQDLVLWAKALYEGEAMPGDYQEDLFDSVPIVDGIRYGAGVGIYERGPLGPTYGHGGGIPGYTSSMRYYPEHRIAVAFQVNTDIEADEFTSDLEEALAELVASHARSNDDALASNRNLP